MNLPSWIAFAVSCRDEGISFREIHHEPTYTSAESAAARGEPLRHGGKSLLVKVGDTFRLFVLPADRGLDSVAIRKQFGERRSRFATRDELLELTGLVPGSVPPFGRPILPFPLYVDRTLTDNERIAFNAGSLTDSIVMSLADYLAAAHPESIFPFSKPRR
jgi:prolyl-tRNA editing enzyme YbaK/EbsC (Cys-tRNA(Pro) deacylase)